MATTAGVVSNLRRNAEAQEHRDLTAADAHRPMQSTAGRVAQRSADNGFGKGQMPSAKTDLDCCTEAYFELVNEGEHKGEYLVRAYINHGARCEDEETRCPELSVIARDQFAKNPAISASQLHLYILREHNGIRASKPMCNSALWRLRQSKAVLEEHDYASSKAAPTSVRLLPPRLAHVPLQKFSPAPPPPFSTPLTYRWRRFSGSSMFLTTLVLARTPRLWAVAFPLVWCQGLLMTSLPRAPLFAPLCRVAGPSPWRQRC